MSNQTKEKKPSDFNDSYNINGIEVVKIAINEAKPAGELIVINKPIVNDSPIPSENERPRFKVFDDWIKKPDGKKLKAGVWYFSAKSGKDSKIELIEQWICSPIHIEATTLDGHDNNFGRMLRFKNTTGKWRNWAMPMELLSGDGNQLRAELLSMGVEIDPVSGRALLARYLQHKPPSKQIFCALQVGWYGDSFVLPNTVIGKNADGVIFQSGERGHDEYTTTGTLEGWKTEIAERAKNNPLLILAISCAFGGALLKKCNAESGGVHFVGDSSTGKTTALKAACSVWGGENYRRSWRSTSNGMEGAAAMFNDGLLALDEISECNGKEIGAIIYSLGNGKGKQRAGRNGSARAITSWQCVIVSSGERTIATSMMEVGERVKAGQSVRLLDIPASRTYGAWDDLHGSTNGAAFSDLIIKGARSHHGTVGIAYLERLTRDKRNLAEYYEKIKLLPAFSSTNSEGQERRAAARFALIGMAGELATEYGLTGWNEGDSINAAAICFELWKSTREGGNDEANKIVEQVTGFIERHGDSRFSNADSEQNEAIRINRAGWWRDESGERTYFFNRDAMSEAVKGYDFKQALNVLVKAGLLDKPETKRMRINSVNSRFYSMKHSALGEHHGA